MGSTGSASGAAAAGAGRKAEPTPHPPTNAPLDAAGAGTTDPACVRAARDAALHEELLAQLNSQKEQKEQRKDAPAQQPQRAVGRRGGVKAAKAKAAAVVAAPKMSPRAVVQKYFSEVVVKARFELLDELVHPTFTMDFPGGIVKGHHQLREQIEHIHKAFPDFVLAIDEQVVQGGQVATLQTMCGTHKGTYMGMYKPSGNHVCVAHMSFMNVQDGKLSKGFARFDNITILRQIGVLPWPAGALHEQRNAGQ